MSNESAAAGTGLGVRLLWFAALWVGGVTVVGLAALVLRLWLKA